jgi:tetratricopeptide (TPR) repeat protein
MGSLKLLASDRSDGVAAPDFEPRVTGHVPQIVAMIERLIERGHAYAAQGHVLFHVPSYADYGQLSKRDPRELLAGARVEVAPYKKDAGDFVLWKPSTPELPGWDSPWGRGRPGWHIECSAMSAALLEQSWVVTLAEESSLGEYAQAIEELERMIREHPRSGKIPDALLRIAESWILMSSPAKAQAVLRQVIESYPKSEARGRARARLDTLALGEGR